MNTKNTLPEEYMYSQSTDFIIVKSLLPFVSQKTFVDIGAEKGSFAQSLFQEGFQGFLFEPCPKHHIVLQELAQRAQARFFSYAIDAIDREADFYINCDEQGKPTDYFHSLRYVANDPRIKHHQKIRVTCRSLQSLFQEGIFDKQIGLLKIDTEGNDLQVLKGIGDVRPEVLMCEFFMQGIYNGWEEGEPYGLIAEAKNLGFHHYLAIKRYRSSELLSWNPSVFSEQQWGNLIFLSDFVYTQAFQELQERLLLSEKRLFHAIEQQELISKQKEQLIQTQQREQATKDALIQAQHQRLSERDDAAQTLREQLEEKERVIQTQQREQAAKDALIQAQNQRLLERDDAAQTLREQLEEKERVIQAQQREQTAKDALIQAQNQRLLERNEAVQILREQLDEKERVIQVQHYHLADQETLAQTLHAQLEEKDRVIQTQQREQAARDALIQAQNQRLLERDEAVQTLREQLEEKERVIQVQQCEQAAKDALIQTQQREQALKDELLDRLRAELEAQTAALTADRVQLSILQAELNEQTQTAAQQQQELVAKEACIQAQHQDLIAKEAVIQQFIAARHSLFRFCDIYYVRPCLKRLLPDSLQTHLRQWRRHVQPKLGIFYQYPPRPVRIPASYHEIPLVRKESSPVVSIVTPSFNHARFLERTMQSVLGQHYPDVEYIVQDGASTDDTLRILESYRDRLTHLESCPDCGQAHAINMGFRHASGEIMAWLNSDDVLLPGTVAYVVNFFLEHPEIDMVYGHRIIIDEQDQEIGRWVLPPHDHTMLLWADYVPQETLFWRRRIWDKAGGYVDESFHFALDWELLLRFYDAGAKFARLPRFLAAFRVHDAQKTSRELEGRGWQEMSKLRKQRHGRDISNEEALRHLRNYMRRHLLYHACYRTGLLQY